MVIMMISFSIAILSFSQSFRKDVQKTHCNGAGPCMQKPLSTLLGA